MHKQYPEDDFVYTNTQGLVLKKENGQNEMPQDNYFDPELGWLPILKDTDTEEERKQKEEFKAKALAKYLETSAIIN